MASAGPGDGLLGTAHDFASGSGNVTADQAVGLCTFCHTPHHARSTLLLWNHTLSQNTFSWDATTTTAGTTFPKISGQTYKGPTAKCLSCHDGSVAIGDIAWFKEQAWPGGVGTSQFKIGSTPDSKEFLIANGSDLSGNHPVAMPYSYQQTANTYNGVIGGKALVLSEWQPDPTTSASAHIRLFNDDGSGNISAGTVVGKTGIECSSCHDPHNKAAIDDLFLRGKVTGSTQADGYLCLQCHIK